MPPCREQRQKLAGIIYAANGLGKPFQEELGCPDLKEMMEEEVEKEEIKNMQESLSFR